MPINRPNWYRIAPKDGLRGLPCPRCAGGKLRLAKKSLTVLEPCYSSAYRSSPDWEPDNIVERWSATLVCDEKECGEIANMIGDTELVEAEIELPSGRVDFGLEDVLRIRAVYPAPPLFRISDNVPRNVRLQLDLAFRMYWTDVSACVGRLRTAIEALLDHQKVPKEKLTTKNKMHRMDLKERIEAFASGAMHQDQLQGLRNIGNLGTHGTEDVTDDDLFDAIDVMEFVLGGIYDTQTIKAKAKKLLGKKPETNPL